MQTNFVLPYSGYQPIRINAESISKASVLNLSKVLILENELKVNKIDK